MELKSVIKKTSRVYPLDNDLVVDFYTDIPVGVADALQNADISEVNKMVALLESVIADWNFADEKGEKLAISKDSINRLGSNLVKWLVETAVEIIKPDEDKKKD